jgi:autotransporter-associated beta strand protein
VASIAPLLSLLVSHAAGAPLYFDGNGSAPGAGTPPGGTWGTWGVDSLWSTASDGTLPATVWTPGSTAVFSAGADAAGPFTIAVSGGQSIGGINVEEGSPTLTGGSLDMGATGVTMDIGDGSTLTIQSILSGSTARLTKSGAGTLVLGTVLNQPNSFGGGIALNGGAIEFQGEVNGTSGSFNPLGTAPSGVTSDYFQFSNGALLRSYRNNTSSAFVVANRGVTLNSGGGGFDVASPGASLSYAGVITGSGSFIKEGPGELKVSGLNTYSGGTIVRDGTLSFTSQTSITPGAATVLGAYPAAVTPGAILLDGGTLRNTTTSHNDNNFVGPSFGIRLGAAGGTLDVPGSSGGIPASLLYSGVIDTASGVDTGILNKTGIGELQLSGNNSFDKINITQGLLRAAKADQNFGLVPSSPSPDAITVDGAAIGTTDVSITSPLNRGITIKSGGMGVILNSGWTINGPITGVGGLTLGSIFNFTGAGSQMLVLAGNNDYDGDTTINNGTLSVTSLHGVPDAGRVVLSSSSMGTAIFDINVGAGVTKTIGSLTGGGPNSGYSGRVTLTTGALAVGNGDVSFTYNGQISGNGGFQKIGTGVMTINNWSLANTGDITLSAGSIRLGNSSAQMSSFSTINIASGASFDMNGFDSAVGALSGSGPIVNGGNLLIAGSNISTQTWSGNYTGIGSLAKTGPGTQNLTGTNNFTSVYIDQGVLGVSSSAALGLATGTIQMMGGTLRTTGPVVSPGRAVVIQDDGLGGGGGTIDSSGFDSILSAVSGTGPFIKLASGDLTVDSVRVDDLTIAGGSLTIASNGTASGVSVVHSTAISPAGSLNLTNNKLIDHTTGVGTWSGITYTGLSGLVQIGRNAGNWNGAGGITTTSAAPGGKLYSIGVAKIGDLQKIADSATSTFAGQSVQGSDTIVMYTYGGDANLDGKINIDDYGRIDSNVGRSGSVFGWYNGDFNYDGKINIDDYGIIDGNIGAQGAPIPTILPASSATGGGGLVDRVTPGGVLAVPEPGGIGLVAIIGAGLLRRRRR